MYSYLSGKLVKISDSTIVLDVNGLGYEVHVPLRTLAHLPKAGSSVTIHTYLHIREDAHLLFGFATEEEKGLFKILLGVTGIGPKLALAILSGMGPREFRSCVEAGDEKYLASIPGIGRKTASRVVLELKDKVGGLRMIPGDASFCGQAGGNLARDALMALLALGFTRPQAQGAVERGMKELGKEAGLEELVKVSIKSLGQ